MPCYGVSVAGNHRNRESKHPHDAGRPHCRDHQANHSALSGSRGQKSRPAPSSRCAWPTPGNRRWYLVAWDLSREAWRNLAGGPDRTRSCPWGGAPSRPGLRLPMLSDTWARVDSRTRAVPAPGAKVPAGSLRPRANGRTGATLDLAVPRAAGTAERCVLSTGAENRPRRWFFQGDAMRSGIRIDGAGKPSAPICGRSRPGCNGAARLRAVG